MSGPTYDGPVDLGQQVAGPIVAEFCLRLWSVGSQLDRPDESALLFCARGGLRMHLAYERFLAATGLSARLHTSSLMVSRLVAMRASLARAVEDELSGLLPGAARTLMHEFGRSSAADVAEAMSGLRPDGVGERWDAPVTAESFAALLQHPDGKRVAARIVEQTDLFRRHLDQARAGRDIVVLVDTGLHGTTALLLDEGIPEVRFASALIANYFPPARRERTPRTFGLQLEADGYTPLRRRSVMLRYWHFVEWLFEPPLTSVRTFSEVRGTIRSNLEVPGWESSVGADAGSVFAGVLDYLDGLGAGPALRVVPEAERAWARLHRMVVFPSRSDAELLAVSGRTHDFGRDEGWTQRAWNGPLGSLRGATMWREGEIATFAGPWRVPLLVAVQAAYTGRRLKGFVAKVRP